MARCGGCCVLAAPGTGCQVIEPACVRVQGGYKIMHLVAVAIVCFLLGWLF